MSHEPSSLMSSAVQHEVNNPLTYVMSNLEYLARRLTELRRDLPPAVAKELEETARDAMDGAQRIRQLMIALRAMGSDTLHEEPKPIVLADAIDSALFAVRNQLRGRAMLVCAPVPVPRVLATENGLIQALVGLLSNAIDSIEPGHMLENEIRVTSGVHQSLAFVDIADTGCGIRPEHRSRIFEPFFTTKGEKRGAGVGLSMVLHTLRAIGGGIEVRSEWGKGTTIRLNLRLETASTALVKVAEPRPAEDAPARVLVIDDDRLVGRAIARVLRGLDVTSVDSGEKALELLQRDPHFDVILCDLMMPSMSGIDLQARVREISPELAERFSFITGGAFTPETQTFVEQTPQRVMHKPLMTNELRGVIERELASHRRW